MNYVCVNRHEVDNPLLRVQLEKISVIHDIIRKDEITYQYINYLSGKNSAILVNDTTRVKTESIILQVVQGRIEYLSIESKNKIKKVV